MGYIVALPFIPSTPLGYIILAIQGLVGLGLVLGIVTRINAFVAFCFYIPSLIILGSIEVFGHIINLAMWIVLMVFGSGGKLKLPLSPTVSNVNNTITQ